jgi:hypothetical protein
MSTSRRSTNALLVLVSPSALTLSTLGGLFEQRPEPWLYVAIGGGCHIVGC